jgi:RNA polymerase sigma-70 factor (ECF subfamily)
VGADDDRIDVERVLAGDLASFENIVRRWQGFLVNLAYRFCRDRSRAEEMAQEAFLRSWCGLSTWRRDAAFFTWLFALATNLYRTELRRITVGRVSLDKAGQLRDASCEHGGLDIDDRDRAVQRAVLALPAKYREALTLFYFHDMNVRDAALSLGLPEGTVKARLSRAREMLRGKLPREVR